MTESPVLITASGNLGRVTLNRPKVINALSHDMVGLIHTALDGWRRDDRVVAVVLDGAGDRGLCAGGDIRAVHADAVSGATASVRYWADEYRLNVAIAEYEKPIVALMDGLVMGGGVGLAGHASHRIVNETSIVSMPEATIGFSPDVGGTFLLARAPGQLGVHLGLTSARMDAADAMHCGFADAFVPGARRETLINALLDVGPDSAVRELATEPPASALASEQHWIDDCYSPATVEEILARLRDSEHGGAAAATIERLSPTSLKVTLAAVRLAAADESVRESVARELRVSAYALTSHDLVEGIRAQIIDKDRAPRWRPASLAEVSEADVQAYFGPLDDGELTFA